MVEFQEEQHSRPSPFFDRRQTVSGVGRGEQRRIYDERKRRAIPEHGLRLVVIEKVAFEVRSRRIVRDRARDLEVVRVGFRLLEDQETQLAALRLALVAGEDSGAPVPLDFNDFVSAKKQ